MSHKFLFFAGTFHEWTIENQSPGGAAKLSKTALDLMFLAVRIEQGGNHKSSVLRTHPPHGFDGIERMTYYGSYPVSKLDIGGFNLSSLLPCRNEIPHRVQFHPMRYVLRWDSFMFIRIAIQVQNKLFMVKLDQYCNETKRFLDIVAK